MSNATDLKSLGEEIAAAYTRRTQDIRRINEESHRIRQEGRALVADFAEADKARAKEVDELKGAADGLVGDFAEAGKARAKEVDELKAGADALIADYAQASKARAQEVDELKGAADTLVSDFAEAGKARAKEVDELKAGADALIADYAQASKARAQEVDELKGAADTLVSDFAKAGKARAKEVAELKAGADALVAAFRAEQAAAAKVWQKLLRTMSAARGVAPGKTKASRPAVARAETAAEKLSPSQLKRKVRSLIRQSKQEGIKLAPIAETLGLDNWRTLIPVTRELIKEGEVEKEGSLYSAT